MARYHASGLNSACDSETALLATKRACSGLTDRPVIWRTVSALISLNETTIAGALVKIELAVGPAWAAPRRPPSVDEHGVIWRLGWDLYRERLHWPAANDLSLVCRAHRDDDERARLEVLALVAKPHRAASFDDVLDFVGLRMDVLADVAGLNRDRGVVRDNQRFAGLLRVGGLGKIVVLERREIDDLRRQRRGRGMRMRHCPMRERRDQDSSDECGGDRKTKGSSGMTHRSSFRIDLQTFLFFLPYLLPFTTTAGVGASFTIN